MVYLENKILKKCFPLVSFERKKAVQTTNIQNTRLNQECGILLTKTQGHSPVLL